MPSLSPESSAALTDDDAMRLALAQADAAAAAGEVPVGAVLVRGGQVIATGANAPIARHDPTAHAEIVALRRAAEALGNYRLEGCTLYVTLEPCPMCAGALLHARLARVVYGAADPKTGAAGSVVDLFAQPLLNHQTEVQGGVLAGDCGRLLQDFFRTRRQVQAAQAHPLREDALRTPAGAFDRHGAAAWEGGYRADLPALEGLRLHVVDRPAVDLTRATTWLCLHGPTSWGLRFAELAGVWAAAGDRVVVPDLVGFGRSDKPKRESFHRVGWHGQVLNELATALALGRVVVVAEEGDEALAHAVAAALGPQLRGMLWLPRGGSGADEAPFPDRGHAAGRRVFAGGWKPVAGEDGAPAAAVAAPQVPMLQTGPGDAARQAQQAMEYFRA
ncbi:MAG: tRNA adenosine(34) deaminase TadA [Pseudomonadota bacterium]